MTELEKMLQGKIYDGSDEEIRSISRKAHRLCKEYNDCYDDEWEKKKQIMNELFPNKKDGVYFQGPIYIDYGKFTYLGKNVYANFNLTILDTCPVKIGDNVFMGPNVSIVTPMHPFRYQERNQYIKPNGVQIDDEYAKPITIEENCWIASNVTICGGVTIHSGCVIGAGSVVIHDIPNDSLACGNPCRVIRKITEKDSIHLKKQLY